jgi:hypothetical protein
VIGSPRTLATIAVAAAALASCSGGGSTTSAAPQAVPSSGGRAQATITIKYTQGTHHLATHSNRRSPRFVDPAGAYLNVSSLSSTNPSFQMHASIAIAPGTDGTQTITAPILSSPGATDTTLVDVIETSSTSQQLANGEAVLTSVQPGTSVTAPPITLYMTVQGIGITTDPLNGSDAIALSSDPTAPTPWPICSQTSWLFAFDATGAWTTQFQTAVGQGGIPTPQILTQVSDGAGGTSRLTSTQTNGIRLLLDTNGDGVTAHLQTYDIDPFDNNYTQSMWDAYVHFTDNC